MSSDPLFAYDRPLWSLYANKQRSVSSAEGTDWFGLAVSRRSVREYFDTLDQAGAIVATRFWLPGNPSRLLRSTPLQSSAGKSRIGRNREAFNAQAPRSLQLAQGPHAFPDV